MHTIIHHRNYLVRYLLCFFITAILCIIAPTILAWPLRSSWIFWGLALGLLGSSGRLICGLIPVSLKQGLKQIAKLWCWQGLAALYLGCLQLINQPVLHYPQLSAHNTLFLLDSLGQIPLLASITSVLAYVVYQKPQPLNLIPLFPIGSNALTRRVIFCNTLLRDACATIGIFGLCSSIVLFLHYFSSGTQHITVVALSTLLTLLLINLKKTRQTLRRLAARFGFISTILFIIGLFIVLLWLNAQLFVRWQMADPNLLPYLGTIDIHSLWQCTSMLIAAPLIFKGVSYCQGLSLRWATLGQLFNPLWALGFLRYYEPAKLSTYFTSTPALIVAALFVLVSSLVYLNSRWFANLTERLFTDTGHQYQGHLRWFFNPRLQIFLVFWLSILSLNIGYATMTFLGGAAVGSLLVYIHLYFFFWNRLHEQHQRL